MSDKPERRRTSVKPTTPQSGLASWMTPDRMIIGGVAAAVIIIMAVLMMNANNQSSVGEVDFEGVVAYENLSQAHVDTPVEYNVIPPVGGPHNAAWQTCGVYNQPLIDEHAVHSLEHGAVWITYQPDLPAEDLMLLESITVQTQHRLLSPYPGIDSPIIVSAWGYQLKVESAEDPRLMAFIEEYEQGPTTPERGATCLRGVTETAVSAQ